MTNQAIIWCAFGALMPSNIFASLLLAVIASLTIGSKRQF